MSTDSSAISTQKTVIEFKSSTFVVPAIIIHSADLTQIGDSINHKIKQIPEFFKNSPVLIDIQDLSTKQVSLNLASLLKLIRATTLIPIALRGGTAEQNQLALKSGLFIQSSQATLDADKSLQAIPTMQHTVSAVIITDTTHSPIRTDRRKVKSSAAISKIVTSPVRSGQRLYSEGDLIIMAHVSAGAEIMAEGNIHVYGSLRGRALAGVMGKTESRIFCTDCQAELISIAGNYKVTDDLDPTIQHKPVQIYLQDQALIIKEL
ncbi:MAG: septum site-determining protein MinC [Methylococcaceae bacterium]